MRRMAGHLVSIGAAARVRNLSLLDPRGWTVSMGLDLMSGPTDTFFNLALPNLESLGLIVFSVDTKRLASFLRRSVNLRRLDLTLRDAKNFDLDEHQNSLAIHLPKLESLRLMDIDKRIIETIIPLISSPVIIELVIITLVKVVAGVENILLSGLHTSYRCLERLTVGGSMSSSDILSALRHTPHVAVLDFFKPNKNPPLDVILDAILQDSFKKRLLLPSLERLSFHGEPPSLATIRRFIDDPIGSNIKIVAFSEIVMKMYSDEALDTLAEQVAIVEWALPRMYYTFWVGQRLDVTRRITIS